MSIDIRLWHGGIPGLKVGDVLEAGHERRTHDGCPWCEARARGEAHHGMDGPSQQQAVYVTPSREYARHYASLWGCGDLYQVMPLGPLTRSVEDSIETYTCERAKVLAVYDRAVLLTPSQRRRLFREWTAADLATTSATTPPKGTK